jgi:DNA mismatch repair protein MutL
MPRIKELSLDVRGKIAAGEVIIRPSSVIKELLENSIDADAKRIEIEIEEGGRFMCLVNDDGSGISRDDALLAVKRYATSKISSVEDIENIHTLGFRGEALASIAQVSCFEMETSDGSEGTRLEIRGGELLNIAASRRSRGTKVKVTELFYNLPARLKFLRSAEYERRLIVETTKSYMPVYPSIAFLLVEPKRTILNVAQARTIKDRLAMLYPGDLTANLIMLDLQVGDIALRGFISPPGLSTESGFTHIYVNSRPVKYPRLYRVIMEACQNPKTPPSFILNIMVKPAMLDVNIHPAKHEVKLKDEKYVIDLLYQCIKKRVFPGPVKAMHQPANKGSDAVFPAVPGSAQFVQEGILPYISGKPSSAVQDREPAEFWQLHNTYIVTQTSTGMIIIDQHVAHERVLFESIMNGKSASQRMLFPITLELSAEEYRAYQGTREMLAGMGMEFKEFSSRTVVIDGLPSDIKVTREDIKDLFSEIRSLGSLMKVKGEIAKVIACKGAVKAGQRLSAVEMQSLVDRLFACENPYTCPHGRPIVLKFSLDELARKFGR